MSTTRPEIEHQIAMLTEEQFRVKDFINSHGLDCTAASFVVLAVEYRNKLKAHIKILKENLDDF